MFLPVKKIQLHGDIWINRKKVNALYIWQIHILNEWTNINKIIINQGSFNHRGECNRVTNDINHSAIYDSVLTNWTCLIVKSEINFDISKNVFARQMKYKRSASELNSNIISKFHKHIFSFSECLSSTISLNVSKYAFLLQFWLEDPKCKYVNIIKVKIKCITSEQLFA